MDEVLLLQSSNFYEPETDEVEIYPDGEEVDPGSALGKGHTGIWDY